MAGGNRRTHADSPRDVKLLCGERRAGTATSPPSRSWRMFWLGSTERSAAIAPRASLTERARREACRRVGRDGHSVAQVARDLGVSVA